LPGYGGGYDGFIGGASFYCEALHSLIFFGNPEYHPDFHRMLRFSAGYGTNLISLNDEHLIDLGGAAVSE
jgi:hypothetical protein